MKNYASYKNIHLFDTRMMGLDGFCGIYLIRGNKNVIIDTGTKEYSDSFAAYLKKNKIFPDYILITHNHHDHIGGLSTLLNAFGQNKPVTVISSKTGKARLKDPNTINQLYTDVVYEPIDNVTVFEDGEILDLGDIKLQIIYTPGHSEDSISVYDYVSKTIFPGDMPGDWLWGKTYLSPHITPDFSEEKYFQSTEKVLSLDFQCAAFSHYGFFKGKDAHLIFDQQIERYMNWKKVLVPAWNKHRQGLIGMVITSVEKGWVDANNAFCDMIGYSINELSSMTWPELTYPDDLEADLIQFRRLLAGKINNYSMEKRFIRKDNKIIYTAVSINAIYKADDNSLDYILALVQDITVRKQAEKEKTEAQLYAAKQEKHALVGQIAGKMAHDFNNILGVIMGNTELSLLDCKETETRKTLELILEQTVRGKNLTKNLVSPVYLRQY